MTGPDLEGPYVAACDAQNARDEFFADHISTRSIAAKAMMELCHYLEFDSRGDAMFGELQQSLCDDGVDHDDRELADEDINETIGSGPAKWLAALTRAVDAKQRRLAKDAARKARLAETAALIKKVME